MIVKPHVSNWSKQEVDNAMIMSLIVGAGMGGGGVGGSAKGWPVDLFSAYRQPALVGGELFHQPCP